MYSPSTTVGSVPVGSTSAKAPMAPLQQSQQTPAANGRSPSATTAISILPAQNSFHREEGSMSAQSSLGDVRVFSPAKELRHSDDVDTQLDMVRKKRKVIQRDLHRLALKFEEIKEKYYYNKDRLIDEEKRDVVAGDHKELLEQMDEIQRQHDERLHIAETRYNYTKKCAAVEFEATKESCNTQLFAQRAALRWALMKETYEMLLQAQAERDKVYQHLTGLDVEYHEFEEACGGLEDPTVRYERLGLLPEKPNSLVTSERDQDLQAIREAGKLL